MTDRERNTQYQKSRFVDFVILLQLVLTLMSVTHLQARQYNSSYNAARAQILNVGELFAQQQKSE